MIRRDPLARASRSAAGHRSHVRALRGKDPLARSQLVVERRAGVHRRGPLHRARLDRVDGRISSTAPRCCSSMRPASARFWISAASARSSGCRRISPMSACTTTASTTSAPTATCGGSARERRVADDPWRQSFLRAGAEGQRRGPGPPLDDAPDGGGFIYSFNGAHSLFVDTIRSLRALALSHRLGHRLSDEQDVQINLLERLLQHARATAAFSVYPRQGSRYLRRARARRARVTVQRRQRHLSRPQQSAGLLALQHMDARPGLGDARIRRADRVPATRSTMPRSRANRAPRVDAWMLEAARATCDFYIDHAACADGIPYWDTGAPGLASLPGWAERRRRSLQRRRTGRQFRRGDRRAGPVAPRPHPRSRGDCRAIATRKRDCGCSTRCSIRRGRI